MDDLRAALIEHIATRHVLSPGQCGGHADALMAEFDVRMKGEGSPSTDPDQEAAFRKALTFACNDPGHFVGFKGERGLGQWQADALLAGPLAPLIARSTAAEAERDEALKVGIKAGIDAAIRGIDATVLNLGSECDRRGIQDRETGEVPCDGEEDRGCACSEALELGDRLIKNLRTCDVAKIAALTQPATPASDEATR